MKKRKILLALGTVCLLLEAVLSAVPIRAVVEPEITLSATEGKIGDFVLVSGSYFTANSFIRLYFSSKKGDTKSSIDSQITAYKYLGIFFIDAAGKVAVNTSFQIPDRLSDGKDKEYVHGGNYYVYATYTSSKEVKAFAVFSIALATIEIEPKEGKVGSKINVSGKDMRNQEKITASYDGRDIAIVSGDEKTDSAGRVHCSIIIPESTCKKHTIAITDESGNAPKADFTVESEIFLSPATQSIGGIVEVRGTGFGERKPVSIFLDGHEVHITLAPVFTTRYGSFTASFTLPFDFAYVDGAIGKVAVSDTSTTSTADLSISPITPAIKLVPKTTTTSPGHVGMELIVSGTWFPPGDVVKITYDGQEKQLTTAQIGGDRSFSTRITIPPGTAGAHKIIATCDKVSATDTFLMEQETPSVPVMRSPEYSWASRDVPQLYWLGVTDPSGITYILQVGEDAHLSSTLVEKKGLTTTKYSFTTEEKRLLGERGTACYWRIKAVDGAGNESEWSAPGSFYVGFSWTQIPGWAVYAWAGLGLILAVIAFLWLREGFPRKQKGAPQ